MKTKFDQRAEIRFCVWEGISPVETYNRLKAVHGQMCLCRASVFRWHKQLREGRDLKDKPKGTPPRVATPKKVQEVAAQLERDRRFSIATLAKDNKISVGTAHKIVRKNLQMKKGPAQWVPHLLNEDQKQRRVDRSREAIQFLRRRNQPNHIICEDESWFRCWDPEDKRSSMTWRKVGETRPVKSRIPRTTLKVMLVIFFDARGVVHREYVPDRVGITKELYLQIVQRMHESVRRKRRDIFPNQFVLLHDNAGAHIARIVNDFLRDKEISVVPHPGLSPDLSPPDFWLFWRLKKMVRGVIYHNLEDLKAAVDAALDNIPAADFAHALQVSYPARLRKCIQSGGAYFE